MIHYALTCAEGHEFDSWFQSSQAYEALRAAGHVACAICGSTEVHRAPMAPAVSTSGSAPRRLSTPRGDVEKAMAEIRRQVEENSDYVGLSFADEARAIHDGAAPNRAIWGEAKPDDAKKLLEDGIPVAPLPFLPKRKAN
ncbi:MAG: hypothetical protein HLUCCA08_16440 [Rhodobacteraceae bacterium HLUCCA08]|nr:MAG: hypothetical protein HLUCCA08_16440 [Rhodobacteraceae bacterium HLUCCA08]